MIVEALLYQLRFQLVAKLLTKLLYFRPNEESAVGLVGVVFVVVLVVIFSFVKLFERRDFSYNRFGEYARSIQLALVGIRRLALLVVVIEHRRTVLWAFIIALAVQGSRVMCVPEYFEQRFIAYYGGVISNLQHFSMAGGACTHLLIGGVYYLATRVARFYLDYTIQLLEHGLSTPEAAITERSHFGFRRCGGIHTLFWGLCLVTGG